MSEHEEVRQLMALAAAGALEAQEQRRVEAHLGACEACRAEFRDWAALAADLGRLPQVAAPPYLAARTSARVLAELAEAAGRRWENGILCLAILLAWAVGAATWFTIRLLGGPVFAAACVIIAGITAALTAALLAHGRRSERRTA